MAQPKSETGASKRPANRHRSARRRLPDPLLEDEWPIPGIDAPCQAFRQGGRLASASMGANTGVAASAGMAIGARARRLADVVEIFRPARSSRRVSGMAARRPRHATRKKAAVGDDADFAPCPTQRLIRAAHHQARGAASVAPVIGHTIRPGSRGRALTASQFGDYDGPRLRPSPSPQPARMKPGAADGASPTPRSAGEAAPQGRDLVAGSDAPALRPRSGRRASTDAQVRHPGAAAPRAPLIVRSPPRAGEPPSNWAERGRRAGRCRERSSRARAGRRPLTAPRPSVRSGRKPRFDLARNEAGFSRRPRRSRSA